MKNIKKIIFSFIFILVFSMLFVGDVKAVGEGIDYLLPTRPNIMPERGKETNLFLDVNGIYQREIIFKYADGSTKIFYGLNARLAILLNPNIDGDSEYELLGDNWFTVYSLDSNLDYPTYGIINRYKYPTGYLPNSSFSNDAESPLKEIVKYALTNNKDLRNTFINVKDKVYSGNFDVEFDLNGKTYEEVMNEFASEKEAEVLIKKIIMYHYSEDAGIEEVVIPASELSGNESDTTYSLKIKLTDQIFDKYYADNIDNKNYNHALWIAEHSYPTIDLEQSLIMAGVDYNMLLNEIKEINIVDVYSEDNISNEMLIEEAKNYVYSTIQYAIWKVNNGVDFEGIELGDEIVNSSELNKLYQYLIKDRDEYKDYDKLEYNDSINIKCPTNNEIFKNTKEYYMYGPYTIDNNFMFVDEILLNIDDNKAGVSIVDKNGNEISKINSGESFYIKVNKKNKVTNIKIKICAKNVTTFASNDNRGRVFTANYPFVTNTISGGKIEMKDINKTVDIVFNPKTGVQNIGTIISIILVVFSLVYLALNIKSKPVEL